MNPLNFCRKFNFGQLLFEALFYIIGTFGKNQWLNQNNHQLLLKNPPVMITTSHHLEVNKIQTKYVMSFLEQSIEAVGT